MTSNEQASRFRALVDQFEIPVFVLDETGAFEYVSPELVDHAADGVDDATPEDLVGRDVEAVLTDGHGALLSDRNSDSSERCTNSPERRTTTVTFEFEPWNVSERKFDVLSVNGEYLGYPKSAERFSAVLDRPAETEAESEAFVTVLEQLHDVTNRLYGATSVSAGLDTVIDAAVEVLGFDWCLLASASNDVFEIRATSEKAPVNVGDRPLATDEGLVGAVYQSGEPELTADVERSDVARPTHSFIRSMITVPVGSWGVFQALSTDRGTFDEQDQQLAETLVAPLATMIERVQREGELRESYDTQERQRRQIESLHTVATRMKGATSRTEVYEMTIEAVEDILEFDLCIIDEAEDEVLVPKAVSSNMSIDDYYEETPIEQADSLGARTYRQGKTFVVDDLHDAGYAPAQSAYTSALSLPLGDWGLFQIASEEHAAFDETDRRLAELLVEHAVAAIDRIDREQELERRAKELEQQNARLDEFASIVSHDLRNPLNVAALRTEHTLRTEELDSLEAVADALDRMETIIDDVLRLAREGETIDEMSPVDLHRVANRYWDQVPADDASMTVSGGMTLKADENRLGHLFENLFRNSTEHTPGDVTIEVGPLPGSGGFYVEDDGPGIEEDGREKVFERGYTDSESGTGLGLSIVKEVVDAHGWSVRITEGEMGGARFEITDVAVVE